MKNFLLFTTIIFFISCSSAVDNIEEVQTYNFITIEPELSIDYFLQSTEEDLWNQMIITDIISLMKKGLNFYKSVISEFLVSKNSNSLFHL